MKKLQTVAELPTFTHQAAAIFSAEEKQDVIFFLAANPLAGDEIPGTGGVRKVRVPAKGKGKRGGARVIYYWYSENAPLYALLVYTKNRKTDLTPDEARTVSALAKGIKDHYRTRTK
ncbi:type II toxin-antitoxin system RelE/ParE family toxin [Pseudomonas sp. R2.Fl]|nr:type II toxin-antitoxin system RelE/ParE family toxin [Pseudomonas sp. R2.Fl]